MATHSEDDIELSLAKIAIIALILLWIVLPFLISELQAEEIPEASAGELFTSRPDALL